MSLVYEIQKENLQFGGHLYCRFYILYHRADISLSKLKETLEQRNNWFKKGRKNYSEFGNSHNYP